MAEIIRWTWKQQPIWELVIEERTPEVIRWSLYTIGSPVPSSAVFRCPKSAIPEIIAALTKLALEGEE